MFLEWLLHQENIQEENNMKLCLDTFWEQHRTFTGVSLVGEKLKDANGLDIFDGYNINYENSNLKRP